MAQNLVPNGDFEAIAPYDNPCGSWASYTTGFGGCPSGRLSCDIDDWFEPGGGSTDIYTKCRCASTGTGFYRCEGENGQGPTIEPANGRSTIWLRYYSLVDYAAVELSSPMEAGKLYEVSFDIVLGVGSRYGSDGAFGLYFSETTPSWPFWSTAPASLTPQLPASPLALTDNSGTWQTVTETWEVPAGSPDLHYVTLGNWEPFSSAGVEIDPSGSGGSADVFVDNVSITELTPLGIAHDSTGAAPDVPQPTFSLRPNPVRANHRIHAATDDLEGLRGVEWYDISGKLHRRHAALATLRAPATPGSYQLKFLYHNRTPHYTRVVVLE